MDLTNINKNFYIENVKKLYNEEFINKVSYLFKIIEVFKEKNEFLYKDNESIVVTELENNSDFPKIDKNDNIYFSTDIHGDLTAFLFFLLKSGVARYKKNESSTIYFDIKENKIIDNIENYVNNINNEIQNLIPIPNLEINPDFHNRFIYTGDLLNRGPYTDNCHCLMYYLLNQDINNKIEYITGNHEDLILRNFDKLYDGKNFKYVRKGLFDLVKNNKIKFCTYSNKTIFSHTIFEKDYIIEGFYNILDNNDKITSDLLEKIEKNTELNTNDIKNLSRSLNKLFKNQIISFEKNLNIPIYDSVFIKKVNGIPNGLLWSLNFEFGQKINGLNQVVGHEQKRNAPIINSGIIKADAIQSSGINTILLKGKYVPAYTNATLLNFVNCNCRVFQKNIMVGYIEELFESIETNYNLKLAILNKVKKTNNNIDSKLNNHIIKK